MSTKREKWHLRDLHFKICRGRIPPDHLTTLAYAPSPPKKFSLDRTPMHTTISTLLFVKFSLYLLKRKTNTLAMGKTIICMCECYYWDIALYCLRLK